MHPHLLNSVWLGASLGGGAHAPVAPLHEPEERSCIFAVCSVCCRPASTSFCGRRSSSSSSSSRTRERRAGQAQMPSVYTLAQVGCSRPRQIPLLDIAGHWMSCPPTPWTCSCTVGSRRYTGSGQADALMYCVIAYFTSLLSELPITWLGSTGQE